MNDDITNPNVKRKTIGTKLNDVVVAALEHPRTTLAGLVGGAALVTPAIVGLAVGSLGVAPAVAGIVAGVALALGGLLAADAAE